MNAKHPYAGIIAALTHLSVPFRQVNISISDETLPWLLAKSIPTKADLLTVPDVTDELATALSSQLSSANKLRVGRTKAGEVIYHTDVLPDEVDDAALSFSAVALGGIPYKPAGLVEGLGEVEYGKRYGVKLLNVADFPGLPGVPQTSADIAALPLSPLPPADVLSDAREFKLNKVINHLQTDVAAAFRAYATTASVSAYVERIRKHYGPGKITVTTSYAAPMGYNLPLAYIGYWSSFSGAGQNLPPPHRPTSKAASIPRITFTPYPAELGHQHRVAMTLEIVTALNPNTVAPFTYVCRYLAGSATTEGFQALRYRDPTTGLVYPRGVAVYAPASVEATQQILPADDEDASWLPPADTLFDDAIRLPVTMAEDSVGLPVFRDLVESDWYVIVTPHAVKRLYLQSSTAPVLAHGHSWALDDGPLAPELFIRAQVYTAIFSNTETAAILEAQINASDLTDSQKLVQIAKLDSMKVEETHKISTVVTAFGGGWAPRADVYKEMVAYDIAMAPGTGVDLFSTQFDSDETWKTVINRAESRRKNGRMLGFAAFTTDDGALLSDLDEAVPGLPFPWLLEAGQQPQTVSLHVGSTSVVATSPLETTTVNFSAASEATVGALWRDISRLAVDGAAVAFSSDSLFFGYLLLGPEERTEDKMAAITKVVQRVGSTRLLNEQRHPILAARYPWDYSAETLSGPSSLILVGERADEAFSSFWLTGMNAIFGAPASVAVLDGLPGETYQLRVVNLRPPGVDPT